MSPAPPPDDFARQTRTYAVTALTLGGITFCLLLVGVLIVLYAALLKPKAGGADTNETPSAYSRLGDDFARNAAEHNTAYAPVDYADPVLNNKRAVFLNGAINNLTVRNTIAQLLYLDAKNPRAPIDLYITSYGGDSDCAFALLDTMRLITAPVNVWSLAGAESSGAMILVGATGKRYATASSVIMVHANSEPSKAGDYKSYDDYDLARIHTLWHSRSHLPAAWFPLTGDKEYYLSAQDALKYGVIDAIKGDAAKPFAPR